MCCRLGPYAAASSFGEWSLQAATTAALSSFFWPPMVREKTAAVGEIISGVRGATQSISSVIANVEQMSQAITGSVRVQSEATRRIAESVEGAAVRSRQVADRVSGVNEFASRTRQGAQQILHAVADLNRQAASLQYEAQEFVARVRAA
jgi:methyl-accepting chemotaxis protein